MKQINYIFIVSFLLIALAMNVYGATYEIIQSQLIEGGSGDVIPFSRSSSYDVSGNFTSNNSYNISILSVKLYMTTGLSECQFYAQIFASDINGLPSGVSLGNSNTLNSSQLGVGYANRGVFNLTFNTSVALTTGERYAIVMNRGTCSVASSSIYMVLILDPETAWITGAKTTGSFSATTPNYRPYFILWREVTTTPSNNTYNITNTGLTIINTSNTFKLDINMSVVPNQTTNMSTLNSSANIYYSINTTLNNNCAIFYQKTCVLSATYQNRIMVLKSNLSNETLYNYTLYDNDIYPGYYPFNYSIIDGTIHSSYDLYANNNIRFNVFNFSTITNYTLNLEFMSNTSGTSNLLIYYCNSSYITGNPATNTNCQLIDTFTPTGAYSHNHTYSKHNAVPVVINSVTKTQNSSFIFVNTGNNANAWKVGYITDLGYDNTSFVTGNYNTWTYQDTTQNKIFDIHLHPISQNDTFRYYTTFYDGNTTTTSNTSILTYNIAYQNPSASNIITPICNYDYTLRPNDEDLGENLTITWTNSTSQLGYPISYELKIVNYDDNTQNATITTTTNVSYEWLSTDLNLLIYDTFGLGDKSKLYFGIRAMDTIGSETAYQDCYINFCVNNYVQTTQPCINNLKLITYIDDNYCAIQYDFPTTENNTYESCIVPPTQGEEDIIDAIYILAILLIIIIAIIIIRKFKGEKND